MIKTIVKRMNSLGPKEENLSADAIDWRYRIAEKKALRNKTALLENFYRPPKLKKATRVNRRENNGITKWFILRTTLCKRLEWKLSTRKSDNSK